MNESKYIWIISIWNYKFCSAISDSLTMATFKQWKYELTLNIRCFITLLFFALNQAFKMQNHSTLSLILILAFCINLRLCSVITLSPIYHYPHYNTNYEFFFKILFLDFQIKNYIYAGMFWNILEEDVKICSIICNVQRT